VRLHLLRPGGARLGLQGLLQLGETILVIVEVSAAEGRRGLLGLCDTSGQRLDRLGVPRYPGDGIAIPGDAGATPAFARLVAAGGAA
jgi:hypothetical protein